MVDGWASKPLSEIAAFYSGGTPNKANPAYWGGPIPWVTVKDMKAPRLHGSIDTLTEQGARAVRVVPSGAVLVLVRGMGLFKDLPVVLCDKPVAFNQDIKALVPKKEVDNQFLAHALFARKGDILKHVESAGHGTGRLDTDLLKSTRILLPPLPEQHKMAEILRTWDEAIEKLEVLRAAKQKKLSSLRQKLFGLSGQFRSEWPLRPLSELSTRIQRRNCGNNYPVMTISAKSGFLLQSDKYSRDMAGRSLENYIVLHEGEFAYNKGNSLTYPQGCIFPLERPAALVPHVYFCFALKKGLNQNFYAHLFEAAMLNRQLTRLINSGVRNDGLLNISATDFFGCRLPVPNLETQQTIATALTTAKEEFILLDAELEALTRQKRGLMQKLLTGEWRVRVQSNHTSHEPSEESNLFKKEQAV